MLLLILLAYLAHNVTHALTLPLVRVTLSEALCTRLNEQYFDDRSVWSIIWSCLATLFACSWVAVHPNVPRATDSDTLILGRRLATMGYMLLAPELVIWWAAKQHFSAKDIAAKYPGWTRTHGHFVNMGGFALHDTDESFLRVLDKDTLEELDNAGEIVWPTITEKEIQDRSKADIFSKGIVLMQTTWFVVQCISRFATKLAVTELEVVTLAFAVLNGITYWLWWNKPSDVRCAVPVYLKSLAESELSNSSALDPESKVSKARQQRDASQISPSEKGDDFLTSFKDSFTHRRDRYGPILSILYTLLCAPIKAILHHLWDMMDQDMIPDDDTTRVPTFYSPEEKKKVLRVEPSSWTLIGVIALFGAIHFIPWPFTFPTTAEWWLWGVSTISITGGPLVVLFLLVISQWVSHPILIRILEDSAAFMILMLIPVYMASRIILLILPLILLRSLPPTAFLKLKWSEFLPHI